MKNLSFFLLLLMIPSGILAQQLSPYSPCSDETILERLLQFDPLAKEEREGNERFTKEFIDDLRSERGLPSESKSVVEYTIPVVLHVFHNGEDGMIDMEQALSGLEVLNRDFNGLNEDWTSIDPLFDTIKASLDIEFCLASLDPDGQPTTGVNYYDDEQMMLNNGDLFQYAWDNFRYLNIYLPKYTEGIPSLFTAYAYYPNLSNVQNQTDGIFYSSIRWGYGELSELEDQQEWASVVTHEAGHWLNLIHTFQGGCIGNGDQVDDTPPTLGSGIELEGCYNNDFSCGLATNGENYMDYNHDCKKMFTQGQVDRMTAALNMPARSNLWTQDNLESTGCASVVGLEELTNNPIFSVFPNPSLGLVHVSFHDLPVTLDVYGIQGNLIDSYFIQTSESDIDLSDRDPGVYFLRASNDIGVSQKRIIMR